MSPLQPFAAQTTVQRLLMAERLRDTDARDENKRAELWQRELVRHFAVRRGKNGDIPS
jgi:hypothetical protein